MKKISYIEVDEQNGMLKVPSEIVGKVAQLIKRTIGIDIVEIPVEEQSKKNMSMERKVIVKLLNKFHQYCRAKSLEVLDKELTKYKLKETNLKRFKCRDIYELANNSHVKEQFKLEWEFYLSSGKALEALQQMTIFRDDAKQKSTKLISLLLLECQKKVPYQSVLTQNQ